jgi:hypothetical protein
MEGVMVYLIMEQVSYGGSFRPIAFAETLEELSSFLKQRGYYMNSHAQSVNAIKESLSNDNYCQFFWDTGRRWKMMAGTFRELKRSGQMKFRDKYLKKDFETEAPDTPKSS